MNEVERAVLLARVNPRQTMEARAQLDLARMSLASLEREIAMPIAFPMLLKSSVDWDLLGEQEPGLSNRRLFLPRGKVIGGSGSINAMIYIRGNRADFDGWAADGADGWSYDEVLPYFKRSEDNARDWIQRDRAGSRAKAMSSSLAGNVCDPPGVRMNRSRSALAVCPGNAGFQTEAGDTVAGGANLRGPVRRS
jgi:choline dehydrogenase-like flavoprotein